MLWADCGRSPIAGCSWQRAAPAAAGSARIDADHRDANAPQRHVWACACALEPPDPALCSRCSAASTPATEQAPVAAPTVDGARVLQIADGRGVHHVAHDEALDSLVLGHHGRGGLAAHALHVACSSEQQGWQSGSQTAAVSGCTSSATCLGRKWTPF